ncbi:acyl-CoA dehydrogenase family protein [Candidatus Binatus soli]|jgi:isovaleryl-CoA dehydrogenase|uniref:acyl-CoA dehydrogenase family protein n=1 Tax=Candidatus Binatus soli TaxID=1953413 RepID=UPI003D11210C
MARIAPAPNPYELTEDQCHTLALADEFARKELAPLAKKMDDDEWWPEGLFRRLGAAGYLGLTIPESEGGPGLDLFSSALVGQGFARWNQAVALSWLAHENLCVNNVQRNASPEQKKRYLPGLADGTLVGALALTEPGAGSDALGGMRTTARRDGDHYVLNGRKLFITNGSIADVLLVYAKTSPQLGPKGISAFLVEKSAPGFSVAQKLIKMGFRGSPTAELVFDDCRVPVANRVGEENAGVAVVMSGLDLERAVGATLSIGIAERCLQLGLDYARQRRQFGRPIGEFQIIQAKLADMYTAIESMRLLAYKALAAVNVLEIGGGGRGGVHQLTAASILYCAEATSRVAADALQIHGGSGFMWEMEVNRLYRACKLMEIGAGTSEVRRIIIAEELLRSGVAV